jgi:hypothetical protein
MKIDWNWIDQNSTLVMISFGIVIGIILYFLRNFIPNLINIYMTVLIALFCLLLLFEAIKQIWKFFTNLSKKKERKDN